MKGSGHLMFCLLLVLTAFYPANVNSLKPDDGPKKVLMELFDQFASYAAQSKKSWKVPTEFLNRELTTLEKLKALLEAAKDLAGGDFDEYFGSYVEILHDLNAINKFAKRKNGNPEDMIQLVKKYLGRYLSKFTPKNKCELKKESGEFPEARLGDSPITRFGYPYFDTKSGGTILDRKLPLNLVNGYPIPITVGSRDYVVQGKVPKVLSFFDCFGAYGVIAETLFPNGHWSSKPLDGLAPLSVTVQVQGTMRGGSVGEILVREALERVVRAVDFNLGKGGTISQLVSDALSGDTTIGEYLTPANAISHLRNYAGMTESEFVGMLNSMAEAGDFKEKLGALYTYISRSQQNAKNWDKPENVSHHRSISVTITAYSKPNNNNKASRTLGSSHVTMREIGDALREIKWEAL